MPNRDLPIETIELPGEFLSEKGCLDSFAALWDDPWRRFAISLHIEAQIFPDCQGSPEYL